MEDCTTPSLFKTGEDIKIAYNSQKPEEFVVRDSRMLFLNWAFICIGVMMIISSTLLKLPGLTN